MRVATSWQLDPFCADALVDEIAGTLTDLRIEVEMASSLFDANDVRSLHRGLSGK